MRIFRAIGMGIGILVLQMLTPVIFAGLEATLLKFFETASRLFDATQAVVDRSGL